MNKDNYVKMAHAAYKHASIANRPNFWNCYDDFTAGYNHLRKECLEPLTEEQEEADHQELTKRFDKWLSTYPHRLLAGKQCAVIAMKYAEERIKRICEQ